MQDHSLIIGGTGMLWDVSCRLAQNSDVITSVARTEASLLRLDLKLQRLSCVHHVLALDWSNAEHFIETILQHLEDVGSPKRVIAWIHEPTVGVLLASALSDAGHVCAFYQILGSSVAHPQGGALQKLRKAFPKRLNYHQIILGFHLEETTARWLTHSEISNGVKAALECKKPVYIVGSVEPWSARPG